MKNLKRAIVGLSLSLSMGVANAGTVNMGSYTFNYDDDFWGISSGTVFSQVGDLFTFSNLGYSAEVSGNRRGWRFSSYYDYGSPALSIVANPWFQIASIGNQAAGSLLTVGGNAAGSSAYSGVGQYVVWNGWQQNYTGDWMSSGQGQSDARNYSLSGSVSFAPGATSAVGDYYTWGDAGAYRVGSSAFASHDSTSFSVAVVPEPSTWAMMLGGLGLFGFMSYRRRQYF